LIRMFACCTYGAMEFRLFRGRGRGGQQTSRVAPHTTASQPPSAAILILGCLQCRDLLEIRAVHRTLSTENSITVPNIVTGFHPTHVIPGQPKFHSTICAACKHANQHDAPATTDIHGCPIFGTAFITRLERCIGASISGTPSPVASIIDITALNAHITRAMWMSTLVDDRTTITKAHLARARYLA